MNKHATTLSALALVCGLSACNSSSDGLSEAERDRNLTSSMAPGETAAQQATRAEGINISEGGTFFTGVHGTTTDENASDYPNFIAEADGGTAEIENIVAGVEEVSFPVNLDEIMGKLDASTTEARLARNGITLLNSRDITGRIDREEVDLGAGSRIYGAWMDHAGFAVLTGGRVTEENDREETITITGSVAGAFGDLTGSMPPRPKRCGSTGTCNINWRGVMVGTPAHGPHRHNQLQGDAVLTYDVTENHIDATFNNIKDIDRNANHSVTQVVFRNVPVNNDNGTYGSPVSADRIEGAFYGKDDPQTTSNEDHAETAGTFESDGIIGAFGAKRTRQ
ncbi:MAG: hypothetical protein GDA53_06735 [Rhodobacteraceae bacterium]|nr:hypothetical protein [Paracoccaceae bacterium]